MTPDRERIVEARGIIHGENDTSGRNKALYAVYVAVIVSLSYGVPASQEIVRSVDPKWIAAHLPGPTLGLVGAGVAGVILGVMFVTGRVRGPVVTSLPWADLIVTSPIDRATTLERWWRLSELGCVVAGLLTGLVVGAGLAIGGVAGVGVLGPAAVLGLGFGWAVSRAWLWGQVRQWPTGRRGLAVVLRARRGLGQLHVTVLRSQAASAVTMGGAALAGDLRAVRLEVAARPSRWRSTRLRPGSPVVVVARRDLLGWRRHPVAPAVGLLLQVGAAFGLVLAVGVAGTPNIVALLSIWGGYLGLAGCVEGLRLLSDNSGTTPLLGLSHQAEVGAHCVVPGATAVLAAATGGVAGSLVLGAPAVSALWPVTMTSLLLGGQILAAFRGQPPASAFSPETGVPMMVAWYLRPLAVVLLVGALCSFIAARPGAFWNALTFLVGLGALVVSWGLRRARALAEAHRV